MSIPPVLRHPPRKALVPSASSSTSISSPGVRSIEPQSPDAPMAALENTLLADNQRLKQEIHLSRAQIALLKEMLKEAQEATTSVASASVASSSGSVSLDAVRIAELERQNQILTYQLQWQRGFPVPGDEDVTFQLQTLQLQYAQKTAPNDRKERSIKLNKIQGFVCAAEAEFEQRRLTLVRLRTEMMALTKQKELDDKLAKEDKQQEKKSLKNRQSQFQELQAAKAEKLRKKHEDQNRKANRVTVAELDGSIFMGVSALFNSPAPTIMPAATPLLMPAAAATSASMLAGNEPSARDVAASGRSRESNLVETEAEEVTGDTSSLSGSEEEDDDDADRAD